jgi:hypothetical protein
VPDGDGAQQADELARLAADVLVAVVQIGQGVENHEFRPFVADPCIKLVEQGRVDEDSGRPIGSRRSKRSRPG